MALQILPQFRAPAFENRPPEIPDFGEILTKARMGALSEREQRTLSALREQLLQNQVAKSNIDMAMTPGVSNINLNAAGQFTPNITPAGAMGAGSPEALQATPVISLPGGGNFDPVLAMTRERQEEARKKQEALDFAAKQEERKVREISPGATVGTMADMRGGTSFTAPMRSKGPRFEKQGDDIVVLDDLSGQEIDRISGMGQKDVRSTPQGLFAGVKGDPSSYVRIPGTEPQAAMKPSEKIQAFKVIKDVYDDSAAKIDFYGRGQQLGSDQLKTRLDGVLKGVNGDFSKLSPSAKANFVYAFNKLNDPTSATLLSEFSVIANRMGVLDRLGRFIGKQVSGDDVTPDVARDLYNVVSAVHQQQKERLVNDLIQRKEELDELNKPLTSIGVPKEVAREVEMRINSTKPKPQASSGDKGVTRANVKPQKEIYFKTVEEASKANVPVGTLMVIGGKRAVKE